MKLLSRCAVVTFVLGFAAFGLGGLAAGEKKVKVGDKAPALKGVDENGKTWKSSDVVGKKILVLYFYPAESLVTHDAGRMVSVVNALNAALTNVNFHATDFDTAAAADLPVVAALARVACR